MLSRDIGILNQRIFPASGLVSYWRLSDTGSTIYDSVGSRNGTARDIYQGETGLSGRKCVRMKGISGSDILLAANCFTNAQVVSGSVSLWIKKNGVGTSGYGDFFFAVEGWIVIGTEINTGKVIGISDGGTFKVHNTQNVCDNVWHNIIMTWDNNDNIIYVDGVYKDSISMANSPTPDSTSRTSGIGCYWNGYYYFINGYIQDVGVWSNTRLSLQQAKDIYNLGTGIYY